MFNGSGLDPEKVQLLLTIFIIILTANGTTQYKSGDKIQKKRQDSLERDTELHFKQETSGKEIPSTRKAHSKAPPDSPIQLVCPDPKTHKELLVIEKNIKLLQHIQGPVATIAVVGKFHSGKSFLLNQLMGKQSGFGVGPFVRPQTMGIWMWGKPMKTTLPTGQEVALIFLDTEGFAATNVSESYDARIFAVATLLSSYLVYNSVKIIDQGDIDYLELLARRTQLFALKSQMSKAKWTDEFNHDLLTFPPLMWVVQDFVQSTEDNETPSEWLHRLLSSSAKESEEHQISLRAIFPAVDCHTLFLPATRRSLLQDLSKAQEEDLTSEYKAERDELIKRLLKGLQPKEKNGRPLNGPELASLLEILVEAANEGSLAQIPNRWNSFIERLEKTAKEDCLLFYEAEMAVVHKKYENGPVPEHLLKEWHEALRRKSLKLLTHLLFGLGSVVNESSRSLVRKVEESFEKTLDMNDKKIKLRCGEVQSHIEVLLTEEDDGREASSWLHSHVKSLYSLDCEEELERIQLPVKTVVLSALYTRVEDDATSKYRTSLDFLADSETFNHYFEKLKSSLRNLKDSYTLKNSRALEIVLEKALAAAVGAFEEHIENKKRLPRTPKVMQKMLKNAAAEARQVFYVQSLGVQEEKCCDRHLLLLKAKLSEKSEIADKQNKELVRIQADAKARELLGLFRTSTDSNHISLPLNETDLDDRLRSEVDKVQKSFWSSQMGFETFDEVSHCLQNLECLRVMLPEKITASFLHYPAYYEYQSLGAIGFRVVTEINLGVSDRAHGKLLEDVCSQRRHENMIAYSKEVEIPLKTSKKIVLLTADSYDTEFSITQYIRQVCLVNLDEGKPKYWPVYLKHTIIDNYISTDRDLQVIVRSRRGVWRQLKGFVQWLLWICNLYS